MSKFLTEEMDIIAHEEGVRIVVNKENQVFATATRSYIQITTEQIKIARTVVQCEEARSKIKEGTRLRNFEEISIAEMILLILVKKIEECRSNLKTKIEIASQVLAIINSMSNKIEYG